MNLTLDCKEIVHFHIVLSPKAARMLWSKQKTQGPRIIYMEELLFLVETQSKS